MNKCQGGDIQFHQYLIIIAVMAFCLTVLYTILEAINNARLHVRIVQDLAHSQNHTHSS
jgi:hypothetical protein